MITGTFYRITDLATRLGVSRQRINAILKAEGIESPGYGLVDPEQWDEYETARVRTELLKDAGWLHAGAALVRHDEYDTTCPVCGGQAVEKPATTDEKGSEEWTEGAWPFLCKNGHSSH